MICGSISFTQKIVFNTLVGHAGHTASILPFSSVAGVDQQRLCPSSVWTNSTRPTPYTTYNDPRNKKRGFHKCINANGGLGDSKDGRHGPCRAAREKSAFISRTVYRASEFCMKGLLRLYALVSQILWHAGTSTRQYNTSLRTAPCPVGITVAGMSLWLTSTLH